MVRTHDDWSTSGFELRPVARDTGPFPGRAFLETLWNHRPSGRLCLTESESALIPLVLGETAWHWVGHPDLVDYRSPLGEEVDDLLAVLLTTGPTGHPYRFDSLPAEAAEVVRRGLEKAGLDPRSDQHAVAARLQLPHSYETFLGLIGRKERHEIRRKRRRFEEEHGRPVLVTSRGNSEGFETFVGMHRSSSGAKGRFMTAEMKELFLSLAGQDGWRVEVLSGEEYEPVAAAFVWGDADGFYLYNSAVDRSSGGSPGIVLLSMLIERAIRDGCRVFDFLKGDEPYKFRLGAVARPLFKFEGST